MNLQEEAKGCSGCLQWHHVCKAECCRQFRAPTESVKENREEYSVRTILSPDLAHYYVLRGCSYDFPSGRLKMKKRLFRIEKKEGFTYFFRDCELLKGNLCSAHGTDKKPTICQSFNETKPKTIGQGYVTPNCLANFKVKE